MSEANDAPVLQRSFGRGRIAFKRLAESGQERTVLADLAQSGCIRLRVPRAEPGAMPWAAVINTAGGLTDGDDIALAADWGAGTTAAVTSQAAERIYRARQSPARIETALTVAAHSTALWLPQETIVFDGGRYHRRLTADIADSGTLLACESLIVGRRAMGERVTSASVVDAWRIRYDGRLIFADALRLAGDLEALLDRPAIGGSARAFATIVLVARSCEAHLTIARETAEAFGGAAGVSLIGAGRNGQTLVARIAAADGAALRRCLTSCLDHLLASLGRSRSGGTIGLPRIWSF